MRYGQKCTHLACPGLFCKGRTTAWMPVSRSGFDMQTGQCSLRSAAATFGQDQSRGKRERRSLGSRPDFRRTEIMPSNYRKPRPRTTPKGRSAVLQAKLSLLVMINLAQLWILSATVEAALAKDYAELTPLIIASGVCWLISVTIVLWWKPSKSKRATIGRTE